MQGERDGPSFSAASHSGQFPERLCDCDTPVWSPALAGSHNASEQPLYVVKLIELLLFLFFLLGDAFTLFKKKKKTQCQDNCEKYEHKDLQGVIVE